MFRRKIIYLKIYRTFNVQYTYNYFLLNFYHTNFIGLNTIERVQNLKKILYLRNKMF